MIVSISLVHPKILRAVLPSHRKDGLDGQLAAHFETIRDHYDQAHAEKAGPLYRKSQLCIRPAVFYAATKVEKGKALDLGCGEGLDAIYLSNKGFEAAGIDISTYAIEKARKYAVLFNSGARFDVSNFVRKGITGNYNLITANCVLHTLPDGIKENSIRMMMDHTNDGGVNAITMIHRFEGSLAVGKVDAVDKILQIYFDSGWMLVDWNITLTRSKMQTNIWAVLQKPLETGTLATAKRN